MTDRDLRDLIDVEGIDPAEEARLRRMHELLLEAGPPAELPPELLAPGAPPSAEILQFPSLPRRRWAAAFLVAAAFAFAAFGGGYLFGHSKAKPAKFATARLVEMHPVKTGVAGLAVLRVSNHDAVGNWPMEMTVTGLPEQQQRTAYYELWVTENGKPALPCGAFRVHGKTTTVRFTVPYTFKGIDGWVVTAHAPGAPEPGPIVLTT
jgi:hypothetical protein